MKMKWMILLVVIAAAAATGFFIKSRNSSKDTQIYLKRGDIIEAVYGLGTITASRTYQLKVGITTSIRQVFVKEGDVVKAGSPVIDLLDSGISRAPFTGTITSIPFKVGESVFPQVPIFTMMDLTNCYLNLSLEQQGALRVKKGQNVRLSFESLRGQKFTGKVRTIFPSEGQFIVHIDIDNLPLEILPGMTADVAIDIEKKSNVLLIPVAAVANGKAVIHSENGSSRKVDLKIGTVDGEWAEIMDSGYTETNYVVIRK